MNGHTENKKNTYAHLDRLSTEALEELLCADIKSPDDDDDEVVLHILEVIEQREKAIPTGRLSDVDKALEEFQTYYNIPEMNGVTLYPDVYKRQVFQRAAVHWHAIGCNCNEGKRKAGRSAMTSGINSRRTSQHAHPDHPYRHYEY